jgi:hypothetical protein
MVVPAVFKHTPPTRYCSDHKTLYVPEVFRTKYILDMASGRDLQLWDLARARPLSPFPTSG